MDNMDHAAQYVSSRLAQSVEHQTLNLRVVGSSPTLGDFLGLLTHKRTGRQTTVTCLVAIGNAVDINSRSIIKIKQNTKQISKKEKKTHLPYDGAFPIFTRKKAQ